MILQASLEYTDLSTLVIDLNVKIYFNLICESVLLNHTNMPVPGRSLKLSNVGHSYR